MPPKLKIVAEEILLCGLKSVPMVGKAVEVISAVESRHALLAQGERLDEMVQQMSRMERRMRDLVEEEVRATLERLGQPGLNGPTLTEEVRNLRSIQEQGWEPTLFEGLLRNSSHWNELRSRPQHYGRVLDAHAPIDPDGIHVLIDSGPLRVLELTPFAFASLLANQPRGIPAAEVQARADIWAFPTTNVPTPGRAVSTPASGPAHSFTNSFGMKLVRIEPGSFMMGSPDSDKFATDPEKPAHTVRITKPYFLGVHPVTQGQYQAVMGVNPSWFKSWFRNTDDLPVEQVSWDEAMAFCQRLTANEGGQVRYRLPTEAEWEHACRAGTTTIYPFGNDPIALSAHAWFDGNSITKTHPVGQKKANPWGLHDMLGNVWEWCSDWYEADYYARSPLTDPVGPAKATRRVSRGGGWSAHPRSCRTADRKCSTPQVRYYGLGFRVVAVQE
jgi:formylglycine-generating enzyme required for sulfatase activity